MTAVGIDLGTSNTVVAHFKDGHPHTLSDPAGRRLIPSIISFHPSGTVLVGDSAKMRRFNDGVSTVTGAKRLMGRLWGSPELEEMRKRVPYQLREGANRTVRAQLRGELYSIPELSAFVVRKAKAWAEEALKQRVTQAVITVPANFNELQRQATKLAGELAGLEVLRVLNEPTAAALAYGHIAPAARDQQIAVYDFGGGTFDLTMLKMSERELRVRATAGDMFLGGDDIDLVIANKMAEAYLKAHRYDPRVDMEVFARVRTAAERLKVELSTAEEASIPLNELMYGPGGKPIQWSFSMTRKQLDALLDPFINQSLKVCEDAMELLKATPRDFDRVVLVGGTTLSPRVRQRVSEFFGRQPVEGLDPEEAVALGAAISSTMPVARKQKQGESSSALRAAAPIASAAPGELVPEEVDELDIEPEDEPRSYPITLRPAAFDPESPTDDAPESPPPAAALRSPRRRGNPLAIGATVGLAVAVAGIAALRALHPVAATGDSAPSVAAPGASTPRPSGPSLASLPSASPGVTPDGQPSSPTAGASGAPFASAEPSVSAAPLAAPSASVLPPASAAASAVASPSAASAAPSASASAPRLGHSASPAAPSASAPTDELP